jgi:hypothetical protein
MTSARDHARQAHLDASMRVAFDQARRTPAERELRNARANLMRLADSAVAVDIFEDMVRADERRRLAQLIKDHA